MADVIEHAIAKNEAAAIFDEYAFDLLDSESFSQVDLHLPDHVKEQHFIFVGDDALVLEFVYHKILRLVLEAIFKVVETFLFVVAKAKSNDLTTVDQN